MNEQQADEVIILLKKNNELLTRSIGLLEQQVRLFEKYDAEMLLEDESIRDLLQRSGRT